MKQKVIMNTIVLKASMVDIQHELFGLLLDVTNRYSCVKTLKNIFYTTRRINHIEHNSSAGMFTLL
jgi:hypothetical protein